MINVAWNGCKTYHPDLPGHRIQGGDSDQAHGRREKPKLGSVEAIDIAQIENHGTSIIPFM